MDKSTAINILEDVENSLNGENWKEDSLRTINTYIKNLEIATNDRIKKLIIKHKDYIKKYGENGKKTIALNKKIDKELNNIFNK